MSDYTGHTGEQLLALIAQAVSRLDHLGLAGEVVLRINMAAGPLEIRGRSAALDGKAADSCS